VLSLQTFRNTIQHPLFAGLLRLKDGTLVECANMGEPPLVPREVWGAVQVMFEVRRTGEVKRKVDRPKPAYEVRCGLCGYAMLQRWTTAGVGSWRCSKAASTRCGCAINVENLAAFMRPFGENAVRVTVHPLFVVLEAVGGERLTVKRSAKPPQGAAHWLPVPETSPDGTTITLPAAALETAEPVIFAKYKIKAI